MNPAFLFNIHNQKFQQKLIENKNGIAHIELTPNEIHKQISKIGVWVDTKNNIVQKVISYGKDNNELIITIQEIKSMGKDVDVKFFQFDTKINPDVEVVDLR